MFNKYWLDRVGVLLLAIAGLLVLWSLINGAFTPAKHFNDTNSAFKTK